MAIYIIKILLVVSDFYLGLYSVNPSFGEGGVLCFSEQLDSCCEKAESREMKFRGILLAESPLS